MKTQDIKIIPKYTQLNLIDDVFEPVYHSGRIYIAKSKVNRSKLDIHLRFKKVPETSGYYGDWFIERAKVTRSPAHNNNGLVCFDVDFSKFQRFERASRDVRDYL